jgi:hypothetical protein
MNEHDLILTERLSKRDRVLGLTEETLEAILAEFRHQKDALNNEPQSDQKAEKFRILAQLQGRIEKVLEEIDKIYD